MRPPAPVSTRPAAPDAEKKNGMSISRIIPNRHAHNQARRFRCSKRMAMVGCIFRPPMSKFCRYKNSAMFGGGVVGSGGSVAATAFTFSYSSGMSF